MFFSSKKNPENPKQNSVQKQNNLIILETSSGTA